jgi:hypothetical protein
MATNLAIDEKLLEEAVKMGRCSRLDRVSHLLAIHEYLWPTTPNRTFGGQSPAELIRKEGFLGLLTVRRYLDLERGR